jgi:hypothetical protein
MAHYFPILQPDQANPKHIEHEAVWCLTAESDASSVIKMTIGLQSG